VREPPDHLLRVFLGGAEDDFNLPHDESQRFDLGQSPVSDRVDWPLINKSGESSTSPNFGVERKCRDDELTELIGILSTIVERVRVGSGFNNGGDLKQKQSWLGHGAYGWCLNNRGIRCLEAHSRPHALRGVELSGRHAPVEHKLSRRHCARARALVSVKLFPEQE
jgi:hypothetical protein